MPRGKRPTPAELLAFYEELKKGRSLNEVSRTPGMLHHKTFLKHCGKIPALAHATSQVYRSRDHLRKNLEKAHAKIRGSMSSPRWNVLLAALREGDSINAASSRPGSVPSGHLYRRLKSNPAAREAVTEAMLAHPEGRRRYDALVIDLQKKISVAVAKVHPSAREEVAAEMLAAALDFQISRAKPERHVRDFTRKYWRDNPSKFGPISLDAPVFRDGAMPLHETVADTGSIWA